jgi:hypothetical protein
MWFDRLVELETEYHKLQALVSAQGIRLMEAEDAPAVPPELAERCREYLDRFDRHSNRTIQAALEFCAGRKQQ